LQAQEAQDRSALNKLNNEQNVVSKALQAKAPVAVIDPASPNRNPVVPNIPLNMALGIAIGLAFAFALIIMLEYRDKSFRSLEDVSTIADLPVLGVVPRFRGSAQELFLVPASRPRSMFAEAYRLIRAGIEGSGNPSPTVLMITSSEPDEGKSTTASNLAASAALAGRRVLLIDADIRRSGLSRQFGLLDHPGLTSELLSATIGITPVRTDIPTLHVVPAGPVLTNPAELLDSPNMAQWLGGST